MAAAGIVAAIGRLAVPAIIAGTALIVVALLWWGFFFRPIGLRPALSCLYARGGTCGFIRHVAAEAGRVAYSPAVFWLGAFTLACGGVARIAAAMLKRAGSG
jgi:hypothetical protein